jgi:hypothetical protein
MVRTTTSKGSGKANTQQQGKNKPKSIELSQALQQKQREFEQLKADPEQILEEEEKRQPLCQQE